MSWRRGRSVGASVVAAGRWRSITAKLAAYYCLCTLGVLLAAIAVLYWALTASLASDDRHFLAEKMNVLRTMLREQPNNRALLNEEVLWETRVLAHARYFVQVLDGDGHVVTQTPGMKQAGLKARSFPAPAALTGTVPAVASVTTRHGQRYLLAVARARLGTEQRPQRVVRLALDVANDDRLLERFKYIAVAVLLMGTILSGALGALVARRGLGPLKAMVSAVQETTATRLQDRIEPAEWPQELHSLAVSFNAMRERLATAFTRLSSYAADLAHELRTPLNNLIGETDVTLARPRSAEEYRQTLESNLEEFQRLSRMTDGLLFLARADNDQAMLQRTVVDVHRELAAVRDYFEATAEEQGVRLDCEGDAMLHADPLLLRRALANLVSNALRHTPHGGRVALAALPCDDGTVALTVTDTGTGIAPEHIAKIFDRFYRAEAGHIDAGQGTGLGLAIVKSIVEAHGGGVTLQSHPGEGTRVTLTFPSAAVCVPGKMTGLSS